MVDAKTQAKRSSPSGPIGCKKLSGTIGGKGTTLTKAACTTITVTTTQIPGLSGVKKQDLVMCFPVDPTSFGDANNGFVGALADTNQILVRFVNPTGADITDFTITLEVLIFPFNIA